MIGCGRLAVPHDESEVRGGKRRAPRVRPPTNRVRREGNQCSIDTVILQTCSDMWLTVVIHVTVGCRDPVKIPILFWPLRILGTTTTYPYIQEPFKLTNKSVGAMAT